MRLSFIASSAYLSTLK